MLSLTKKINIYFVLSFIFVFLFIIIKYPASITSNYLDGHYNHYVKDYFFGNYRFTDIFTLKDAGYISLLRNIFLYIAKISTYKLPLGLFLAILMLSKPHFWVFIPILMTIMFLRFHNKNIKSLFLISLLLIPLVLQIIFMNYSQWINSDKFNTFLLTGKSSFDYLLNLPIPVINLYLEMYSYIFIQTQVSYIISIIILLILLGIFIIFTKIKIIKLISFLQITYLQFVSLGLIIFFYYNPQLFALNLNSLEKSFDSPWGATQASYMIFILSILMFVDKISIHYPKYKNIYIFLMMILLFINFNYSNNASFPYPRKDWKGYKQYKNQDRRTFKKK